MSPNPSMDSRDPDVPRMPHIAQPAADMNSHSGEEDIYYTYQADSGPGYFFFCPTGAFMESGQCVTGPHGVYPPYFPVVQQMQRLHPHIPTPPEEGGNDNAKD